MTDEVQAEEETKTRYAVEFRVSGGQEQWGPWHAFTSHYLTPDEAIDARDRLRIRLRHKPGKEVRAVKKVTTTEVLDR
jgi:hypothetical protein